MQIPDKFFGLNRERNIFDDPFEIPQEQLVCIVSNIVKINQKDLIQQSGIEFQIGEWFVSQGSCSNIIVHGPFKTCEAAFDFSFEKLNAVRFMSLLQFS